MTELELLVDLHRAQDRQGPGGDAETRRAMELAGLDRTRPLKVADIGCGTGASTVLLARELDAEITAVDFLPEFLRVLEQRAGDHGVADQVTTLACGMEDLPFGDGEFDVIWSEGAIYNMGFEAGVSAWRRHLKPGGKLVVSEITWLTASRPAEIQAHWEREYPQIDVASAKIGLLERHGYAPAGYFVLQPVCWLENYYRPLEGRFEAFSAKHGESDLARATIEANREEIELYEKFSRYYSYGVYIAQRC